MPREKDWAWPEILLILLSLVLGGISIWLTTWDPLWQLLNVQDVEMRTTLGVALSIVLVLFPILIALYQQSNRLERRVSAEIGAESDRIVERLCQLIPQMTRLAVMRGDVAYEYLVSNLPLAQRAWNTRLAGPGVDPKYNSEGGRRYREALSRALIGGLRFDEVVSTAWQADAVRLEEEVRWKRPAHDYTYHVLEGDIPPMVNFTVLQYPGNRTEVVAGWLNSRITGGFDPMAAIFRELRIVNYFQTWYDELQRVAKPAPPLAEKGFGR